MSFVPGQRPWSQLNSNWQGIFDLAAQLPNVAGSSLQMGVPNVQVGDLAYVVGVGLYVCDDPTAGAAVWNLISTGGGGGIVGPANVVYVEPAPKGDDATGQRGNAALPFATIGAAMLVMQAGDQMRLAPGFYVCDNVSIPAAVTTFSILGSGRNMTGVFYTGAPGGACLLMGNTVGSFALSGISFDASSDPADNVYEIDGTGGGGATLNDGGFISDCNLRGGFTQTNCGRVAFQNCRIRDDAASASNSRINMTDCEFDGNNSAISMSWTGGADAPSRAPSLFSNVTGSPDLVLSGAPWVDFNETCVLDAVTAPAPLTDLGGGVVPNISIHGSVTSLSITFPDTATTCIIDFDHLVVAVSFAIAITADNNRQNASMRDGILKAGGDAIDLIAFGIEVPSKSVYSTPGSGTITPSSITGTIPLAGAAPDIFNYGFGAGAAPTIAISVDSPAAGQVGVVALSSQAQLTPTTPGVANANIIARWN
jgi:hypothetical protein